MVLNNVLSYNISGHLRKKCLLLCFKCHVLSAKHVLVCHRIVIVYKLPVTSDKVKAVLNSTRRMCKPITTEFTMRKSQ